MKFLVPFVCFFLLLSAGCSNQDNLRHQDLDISLQTSGKSIVISDEQDQANEMEPSWALARQDEKKLFEGLNLDGIGIADDTIYISRYTWDGLDQDSDSDWYMFNSTIIVLRAHLGTGETVATILPEAGEYTLQTAALFSPLKDAILLEIRAPVSQVGYSRVYAFDILPAGSEPQSKATIEIRLDTESTMLKSGEDLTEYIITDGTSIVDVPGQELKGIKLYTTGPNAKWRELSETIYWTHSGWSLAS